MVTAPPLAGYSWLCMGEQEVKIDIAITQPKGMLGCPPCRADHTLLDNARRHLGMKLWTDAAGFRPPKSSRKGHHEVCDPRQAGFSELACKAKFPDAYAITYWMHSW